MSLKSLLVLYCVALDSRRRGFTPPIHSLVKTATTLWVFFLQWLWSWTEQLIDLRGLYNGLKHLRHALTRLSLTYTYLVWVVFQRAVVTLVTNSIEIGVFLVDVVQIWAVVVLIQNTCQTELNNGEDWLFSHETCQENMTEIKWLIMEWNMDGK